MRALLLAVTFLFAGVAPAAADRFSLTYEGATLGIIGLGEVSLDADVTEDDYIITANLRSGGILALFERTNLTAHATGQIRNGAVYWSSYDLDHRYSKKRRIVAMRVDEGGAVVAEIEPDYRLWGEPPANDAQRRRSRDPLSSLIAMAIDVGQTRRCAGAYPTFDGRFHYLLELGGGEIKDFRGGGYDGQVLECSLAYIAVSGFEPTDRGRRRVPHGEVWFALDTDSRFAPPVRISTPMSAGGAVIRLTQWRRATVGVQDQSTALIDTP
jgi:hypothetical protein